LWELEIKLTCWLSLTTRSGGGFWRALCFLELTGTVAEVARHRAGDVPLVDSQVLRRLSQLVSKRCGHSQERSACLLDARTGDGHELADEFVVICHGNSVLRIEVQLKFGCSGR
jgi:hypothetical protein